KLSCTSTPSCCCAKRSASFSYVSVSEAAAKTVRVVDSPPPEASLAAEPSLLPVPPQPATVRARIPAPVSAASEVRRAGVRLADGRPAEAFRVRRFGTRRCMGILLDEHEA